VSESEEKSRTEEIRDNIWPELRKVALPDSRFDCECYPPTFRESIAAS